MNTCVKFCDDQIRNKKSVKSVKFDIDLVFDHRRSKCKLLQEMMFMNTYVKFRDNWIRNKVCGVVKPKNLSNSILTLFLTAKGRNANAYKR